MEEEGRASITELDPSVKAYNWCLLHGIRYLDELQPLLDKWPSWWVVKELQELLARWQATHAGLSARDDALRALTDWKDASGMEATDPDDRLGDSLHVGVLRVPSGWMGILVSGHGRWEWECLHSMHPTPSVARECARSEVRRRRLTDRLAGGVWGHLIGDAMGVPYEFGPPVPMNEVRWGKQASYRPQPPGTWSDDGGLMLALLDSLVDVGFDPVNQGRRALHWWLAGRYSPGPLFDIGLITRESLERIRTGTTPEAAGAVGEDENGNGSLMRILPIALAGFRESDANLINLAARASSLTHRHPRSKVTCAVYVIAARSLLAGEQDRSIVLKDAFARVAKCVEDSELNELRVLEQFPIRTGSGYILDCFWSAWDAFAMSDSYAETVRRSISYGHDTDTTACVAGALAGIYWGMNGIPSEWLEGLRGREIVEPIISKLVGRIVWKRPVANQHRSRAR